MDMNAQMEGTWALRPPAAREAEGPACATHAESGAVARCLACGMALCESCRVTVRGCDYCPAHAAEARAARCVPSAPVTWSPPDLTDTWTRTIACGIDLTVLLFCWAGLCLVAAWLIPASVAGMFGAFAGVALALLAAGYFTLSVGAYGQTIGHGLLGLRVLRTDGTAVSYGRAFVRCLGGVLCVATAPFGFLLTACSRNRQGLHDRLADTVLIGPRLPTVTKAWASLFLTAVMAATLLALTPLFGLAY